MIRLLTVAAAALVLAGCASGAPQRPDAGSADADANARATARQLIGEAGDIFQDASLGDTPRVRHRGSGLLCRFSPGPASQGLQIYPEPLPRGQDVGCQLPTDAPDQFHTLFATRYPVARTLDQAMADAVFLMRRQHPSLKPYEGPAAEIALQREDLRAPPASRTARFLIDLNGRQHLTRVSVAVVNGWVIKQRFTTPVGESLEQAGVMSDLIAGLIWADTLLRFTNGDAMDRSAPVRAPTPAART